jgi:hypothetical protein
MTSDASSTAVRCGRSTSDPQKVRMAGGPLISSNVMMTKRCHMATLGIEVPVHSRRDVHEGSYCRHGGLECN